MASDLSFSRWDLHSAMRDLSLRCMDSSLWFAGSVAAAQGMISCSMACRIVVSRTGIESESPALQGGFSTIGPPGMSLAIFTKE